MLHGWAVHSEIWHSVSAALAENFQLLPIDMPGYGTRHAENGDLDLAGLTDDVLERVPKNAHWLGWSLGSMIAISAALNSPDAIASLTLVSPTPKFMQSDDWSHGTAAPALENLRERFHQHYDVALKRFLLMQAGMDKTARDNAKQTFERLTQHPAPQISTLDAGLSILQNTDLRETVHQIQTPTRIIVCHEDRVIPAAAGVALHESIPQSTLCELPTGHAPMIESPAALVSAIRT